MGFGVDTRGPERPRRLPSGLAGWRVQAGILGVGWGSRAGPAVTCSSRRGGDDSEPAPWPEALSAAQPSWEQMFLLASAPASSMEGLFLEGLLLWTLGRGSTKESVTICERESAGRESDPGARLAAGIWPRGALHVPPGPIRLAGSPERWGLRRQEYK